MFGFKVAQNLIREPKHKKKVMVQCDMCYDVTMHRSKEDIREGGNDRVGFLKNKELITCKRRVS